MFWKRSAPRRHDSFSHGKWRADVGRRQASAGFEWLETRQMLTVTWIGGLTGYWDVAANWSNDAVPSSSTAVSITTSGATVTIGPGETESAGSLTIAAGATLSMPARSRCHQPDDEL